MGWIIALAVLILLGLLPLGASVRYHSEGVSLKIIAGPLRIGILPKKEKTDKKDKPKKEKPPKSKAKKGTSSQDKQPEKKEKGGPVSDFLPLVQVALDFLNSFRRKLRVNHLMLKLILAADDPCDLAVNYGRAWAAVGNLMPQLEKCFVIKKRDVEVECDFEATQTVILARLDLTITLGRLLGLLAVYGFRAVKEFIRLQNKRKGGKVT